MESILIEHIELIAHKCSKKRFSQNIGGTNNETPIFQNFLKVVSILFYFKNFMVIMLNCFYKDFLNSPY